MPRKMKRDQVRVVVGKWRLVGKKCQDLEINDEKKGRGGDAPDLVESLPANAPNSISSSPSLT